jgi:hypothetical protein
LRAKVKASPLGDRLGFLTKLSCDGILSSLLHYLGELLGAKLWAFPKKSWELNFGDEPYGGSKLRRKFGFDTNSRTCDVPRFKAPPSRACFDTHSKTRVSYKFKASPPQGRWDPLTNNTARVTMVRMCTRGNQIHKVSINKAILTY